MDSSWIDATLAWIAAHPVLAGAVIFLIAFCDAVIILGAIVPALPLLFAVGVFIGLGQISGPYAVAAAALGAFAGDGISYWIGRRWGDRLRGVWPFSRYPQLLDRGENLFRRNAFKSILIARYVGAIRPFVPAIAGMMKMPASRYVQASGIASISWAVLFLAPGWILGEAYDAVAAVAGRLVVVVGLLAVILGLVWAIVLYGYRWSAARMDSWLARLLDWSNRHPTLGRYTVGVLDPKRRESVPLAMLALMLLVLGWGWFALLTVVVAHGEPLAIDLLVHQAMLALRNPLADYPMAALASLGAWQVLLPATAAAMGYLIWRRRWMAAAHWLAALAFGLALTMLLGATVDVVRPVDASSGFGFPSVSVTMATITFGFFAVLIAREMPGRTRVWPYLVSGIVVSLIGFSRLYLGAHWLSDVIGGMPLQAQLEARGWKRQEQAGWQQALLMLDKNTGADELPVLPATLDTRVEALLMVRQGAQPDERYVLRLWPAPAQLQPGSTPLWLGSAQTLRYERHFEWIGMWHPLRGVDPALNAVKEAVQELPQREDVHSETGLPVLRLKTTTP